MHDDQGVESRAQVVDDDASAFGQPFQSSDGKRLPHIEDTEKYKAREKGFPRQRNGDEGNELPGNFIDNDKLRIL